MRYEIIIILFLIIFIVIRTKAYSTIYYKLVMIDCLNDVQVDMLSGIFLIDLNNTCTICSLELKYYKFKTHHYTLLTKKLYETCVYRY